MFKEVMGCFVTGVTIVTTRNQDGKPYGVTVNSFTSVSLRPKLILVCLDNRLSGLEIFKRNGKFGVNILSEDQEDISAYFARKGTNRSRKRYRIGETGVPLLEGTFASLECAIVELYPGGDHSILVGEVKSATVSENPQGKKPLLFFLRGYRRLKF